MPSKFHFDFLNGCAAIFRAFVEFRAMLKFLQKANIVNFLAASSKDQVSVFKRRLTVRCFAVHGATID
jgi:hypothetical protein